MSKLIYGLMASAAIALPAAAQTTSPGPRMEQSQPPTGAPMERDISPSQLTREQIMELQNALKAKGHDVGAVDGVWGPSTETALRGFQEKQGMMGGPLNARTVTALGLDSARYGNPQGAEPDPRTAPGAPPTGSMPGQPSSPGMQPSSPGSQPNSGTDPATPRAPGAAPNQPSIGTTPGAPSGPAR